MQYQKMSCPTCGAPLSVPSSINRLLCTYCKSQFSVQSGEGYIALKAIEGLGQVIQESNIQTQQKIGEGTQVTQMELQRLQLNQELATTQLQLSNLQAEIRTLERGDKNRKANKQLRELRTQESSLIAQVATLQAALTPSSKASEQLPNTARGQKKVGALAQFFQGCLGLFILFTSCSGLVALGNWITPQQENSEVSTYSTELETIETPNNITASAKVLDTQSKLLIPTATPNSMGAFSSIASAQIPQSTDDTLAISDVAIGSVTVTAEAANIRGGPSLDAYVEGVAKKGTQFLAYAQSRSQQWIAIDSKGNRWIAASTVQFSNEKNISGVLAGITRDDVVARLQQHGLSCGNIDLGEYYYAQNCTLGSSNFQITVVIYGSAPQTVDFINSIVGSFGGPDDSQALALFRALASLPYAGAEPNNATNWVEQTLPTITKNGDERSNDFGGVEFKLFGGPKARNLQIGTLQ